MALGRAAGGRNKQQPAAFGRYWVFECPKCKVISASTLTLPPHNELHCQKQERGCGKLTKFDTAVNKVGIEGWENLSDKLRGVFVELEDAKKAVLQMREKKGALAKRQEDGGGEASTSAAAAAVAAPAVPVEAAVPVEVLRQEPVSKRQKLSQGGDGSSASQPIELSP
jgi:hypothetical protein